MKLSTATPFRLCEIITYCETTEPFSKTKRGVESPDCSFEELTYTTAFKYEGVTGVMSAVTEIETQMRAITAIAEKVQARGTS